MIDLSRLSILRARANHDDFDGSLPKPGRALDPKHQDYPERLRGVRDGRSIGDRLSKSESGKLALPKKRLKMIPKPVVSDRAEWFASSNQAAKAMNMSSGAVANAVRFRTRAKGRYWSFAKGCAA